MKRLSKLIALGLCLLILTGVCAGVQADETYASGQVTATEIKAGETVTLTVSTGEVTARAFVAIVQFDGDFEFVGAKWLMDGHAVYDASKHKGALNFGSEKAVSGDVFQLTLKATKVGASAKNISVTLRANNTSGTKIYEETVTQAVTIACDHSYSAWAGKDGDTHSRTCAACGNVETAKHDWKGEITKGNGCDQEGEMTYTCTVCGATKKEVIQPGDHLWDEGKVTKEATCKEAGEKVFTCSSCDKTKTEAIPVSDKHTYDDGCDATCNVCGQERTPEHQYWDQWSVDPTHHWHACMVCWESRVDEGEHTPGPEATDWEPQVCTVCGYVIQEALGHDHSFGAALISDETGHWYACDTCSEKKDFQKHAFDNNCDTACNACGYTREIEHDYSNRLSSDETGHWNACTVCGEILEKQPHNPGPEATETTDQTCQDCGFLLQAAQSHVHASFGDVLSDDQRHWYQCYCGEMFDHEAHAWSEGARDEIAGKVSYLCTVCGYSKVEQLPGEPGATEPQPTEPEETRPQGNGPAVPGGPEEPEEPQNLDWWWYVVIGVCVLVLGAVIFVIMGILVSRKKTGKYSS